MTNLAEVSAAASRRINHLRVIRGMRPPIESPYTYYEPTTGAAGMCPDAEMRDCVTLANAMVEIVESVANGRGATP